MSNFRFPQNSKIHWSDESSYDACTHPCTREEVAGLYEEIKAAGIERWETVHPSGKVSPKVREEILELIRKYVKDEGR